MAFKERVFEYKENMMGSPWILLGFGILFCSAGVYNFHKNAFEEDKSMFQPILLMIAGVVLIGLSLAKFFL
jgi:hypothetical protein